MKNHSEESDSFEQLREKIIGLGESSARKSYYPSLRKYIDEIERANRELENEIVERKKTEELLIKSEERFQELLRKSSEGIFYVEYHPPVDTSDNISHQVTEVITRGVITESNFALAKLYGYSLPSEMTGKTLLELYGNKIDAINIKATEDFIKSNYKIENLETKELDVDGNIKYFSNTLIGNIKDGMLIGNWGIQKDITIQKKALLLQSMQYRMSNIILSNQDTVKVAGVVEKELRHLLEFDRFILASYNKITGSSTVEYSTHSNMKKTVIHTHDQTLCNLLLHQKNNSVLNQPHLNKIVSEKGSDLSGLIPVSIAFTKLVIKGEMIGLVLVENITNPQFFDQKTVDILNIAATHIGIFLQRKNYLEELIAAKEKAEEMNRVKANFFANMSHELRTPLIGILGYSEILGEELKNDEHLTRMINTIHKGGLRLLETVKLILDLSKYDAGKIAVSPRDVDLVQYLEEEVKLYTAAARQKGLELTFHSMAKEAPCHLDPDLFLNVISNLLNNAIKFTQKGSIQVKLNESGDFWLIRIIDTGIGMSEEEIKLVWDEFRQASEGMGRGYEGSGLGLSIAEKYTRLMNGEINVESELGKGSVFNVKFPKNGNKK